MWRVTFFLIALAAQRATAYYTPDYVENVYGADSRIVSGWESQPGQHPHQVSIRMVRWDGAVTGCGGNVVHREWLITAAHCSASSVTIVVRAGLVDMSRPEMLLETTEYYNHPTFDATRPATVQLNDISLVKLPQPLVYSSNLRPIRVQPSSEAYRDYNGEIVYASGFGRLWTNGAQSQHLMWVFLRAISNASCRSTFSALYVSESTVCARFYNVTSQSICQGDSGGPLVHLSADGNPTLIGISSFVAGPPHGCHSGLPGAFIRPGPFHQWFTQITGIDFNNLNEENETTTTTTTTTTTPSTTTTTTPSTTTTSTTTISSTTTSSSTTTPSTTTTYSTTTPSTTTTSSTTTPSSTTTTTPSTTSTTTILPPSTTEEPDEDDNEDIDDPELADLLKRLEVRVKVKVQFSKYSKKKQIKLE